MAFPIISFISFDKTGSLLTLRDDSVYGGSNPSLGLISKIRLTLSMLDEIEIYKQDFITSQQMLPLINHNPFVVSSTSLGEDPLLGFLPFEDGVLNIDYYVAVGGLKNGTGSKGSLNLVLPVDNTTDYTVYDSIFVGDKTYAIDKLNTSLITLVLVEELEANATQFYPAYRSNIKVLNTKGLDYKLAKQASRTALCCDVSCADLEMLGFKEFAEIAFEEGDYTTASKLLHANCGCEIDGRIILPQTPTLLPS